MKKRSMQSLLSQMTPKQIEGLRILTESGKLEELVKDMEHNLGLTDASKSSNSKSKKRP